MLTTPSSIFSEVDNGFYTDHLPLKTASSKKQKDLVQQQMLVNPAATSLSFARKMQMLVKQRFQQQGTWWVAGLMFIHVLLVAAHSYIL